jgi:ABC-2 type transport system permease protein
MNLGTVWIVASKDLKSVRRKKSIFIGLIVFPLLLAILFPAVLLYVGRNTPEIPTDYLANLLNSFSFFFVVAAGVLPTAIASYSIVGEKMEKSLEPLLATPTTDSQILLGKSLAAFLPPLLTIYASSVLYMLLIDYVTYPRFSYLYYPNWSIVIILFFVIPFAQVLSIELSVIVSSRVNDIRSANQLAGLMFGPFMVIYVASEIGIIMLNDTNLVIIAAVLALVDLVLFYFSTALFRREEILTKWK